MKVSKNAVSCFLKEEGKHFHLKEEKIHIPFTLSSSFAENIQILTNAIKEALFVSEERILKRLERAILLLDFGYLQKKRIKFKASGELNFESLRDKVEKKFENKIVSIYFNGMEENHKIFEVLSVPKPEAQMLLDIVSSIGIEVSEVATDFKFIIEKIFNSSGCKNFIFLKFSNNFLEFAKIKNGLISEYNTSKNFGFNSILEEVQATLNINPESLIKLLKFYNTSSKVDRLKTFYEREIEDFEIKNLIENTSLILNLQNTLKKITERILKEINITSEAEALYFFYSGNHNFLEPENFKLHEFFNTNINIYEFNSFYSLEGEEPSSHLEEKIPITGIFAKQMKKFFYLTP